MLLPPGVGEAYRLARAPRRRRPPALAALDQVKKKSATARSKARAGFGAPLGAASRARPCGASWKKIDDDGLPNALIGQRQSPVTHVCGAEIAA